MLLLLPQDLPQEFIGVFPVVKIAVPGCCLHQPELWFADKEEFMKYLILFSVLTSGAFAEVPQTEDSAPPMPERFQPDDSSARAGNPGTFTSKGPKANVPETKLNMDNHSKPKLDPYVRESRIESEEIQAQEDYQEESKGRK